METTMRTCDEVRARESEIRHCPMRGMCPAGAVCAAEDGQHPLYPKVKQVAAGQVVWSDLRFEQHVTVFRDGVFALAMSEMGSEGEVPVSLLGPGDSAGLAELYIPRELGDYYHLDVLCPGSLCSFPAKPFRRAFETLPSPEREKTLACALVNPTSAQYSQVKMLSRTRVCDRIVMLLARIAELAARSGRAVHEASLSHEQIARLVASDRVTVTRALHKLEEDGLVELGYRCVRFGGERFDEAVHALSPQTTYLHPDRVIGFDEGLSRA